MSRVAKVTSPTVTVTDSTVTLTHGRTKYLSGSGVDAFTVGLLRRMGETLWRPGTMPPEQRAEVLQAALAVMAAFKPTDELEGLIAGQAVALNAASMECLRRAMIRDQPAQFQNDLLKHGANLARAFTDMLDAMDRKRGRGRPQVVRVERVTVEAGGRAIVGNITPGATTGGGGRHGTEIEEQPHEPALLADGVTTGTVRSPLWGKEPGRDAVQIPCNAREGSLSPPRRRKHRSKNG